MRHMKTSDQTQAILFGKIFASYFRIWPKSNRSRSKIKFDFENSWKWIFRSKNQIWFVKIELNFLGQHLAAVKRASNQIITELTYKNFCNNLQVTSLQPTNINDVTYNLMWTPYNNPSNVSLNMWQTGQWQAKDSKHPVISPKL